jgi:hypothetical protein
MTSESDWAEIIQRLPLNSQVMGSAVMHRPQGFFVRLDDAATVPAIVDTISYRPDGDPKAPES